MHRTFESQPMRYEEPEIVADLRNQGYIDVNPLFNVALDNRADVQRYDLINPVNESRLLWTPPSDDASMEVVENVIGNEQHPVFFPLHTHRKNGDLYELPASVRLLTNTLETSPYIPEYTQRLEKRAVEFFGKLALLDEHSFGLDIRDLVINHNGAEDDDVFFSILPPLKASTDENFSLDEGYRAQKKALVRKYIERLQ